MLLISLETDKVVDPASAEKTVRQMRRRGVSNDTLRQYLIKDTNLNHITAAAPAIARARRFFDRKLINDD